MKIALEDANKALTPIIRSIDKRIEFVTALKEGDKAGIALTISRGDRNRKLEIPVEALAAAEEDAIKRQELRNRIKRVFDRMQFRRLPIASTKMLRGSTSADGFFRSPGGPRR